MNTEFCILRAILGSSTTGTLRDLLGVAFQAFEACDGFSKNSETSAYILNLAGVIDNDTGKFEQALHFFKQALEIRENLNPVDIRHLCNSYNNVSEAYGGLCKFDESLAAIKRGLKLVEENFENTPKWRDTKIMSLLTAVEVYRLHQEPDKSLRLLEKASTLITEHNEGDWDIE